MAGGGGGTGRVEGVRKFTSPSHSLGLCNAHSDVGFEGSGCRCSTHITRGLMCWGPGPVRTLPSALHQLDFVFLCPKMEFQTVNRSTGSWTHSLLPVVQDGFGHYV